jgi:hypothetical protein
VREVEERLAAYYGPALPPRPLPETAWLQLRDQLGAPRRRRFDLQRLRLPGARRNLATPANVQEVYAALLTRIDCRRSRPDLRCQLSARRTVPRVSISPLGRGHIRILLPEKGWRAMSAVELEVLLAAGLARCASLSRSLFVLPRLFLVASLLLLMTALPFSAVDRRYLWIFLAAFLGCVASAGLISWQQRALAFRGDRQAVRWLGREQVCRGLHLLAGYERPRHRPTWGEPSLAERIARVCGTPVTTKDEHLTLVG